MSKNETHATVIVNGTTYSILAETQDVDGDSLLVIRRPNGCKEYLARRLPDSPVYGENRGQMLSPMPRR